MSNSHTVVLIDPDGASTSSLAGRLQMQGYQVVVSHDPADGARMALADPPAAVIADLWMPSISGVQLCRLLGAEPATEHVPVLLRGPDSPRNRFWAERAGARSYLVKGRMGDLVRALKMAIDNAPAAGGFFTTFAGQDLRERIAEHLDAALFESAISAEIRGLGTCGAFDRLFDLLSQFASRIVPYRWLAVALDRPARLGVHSNPRSRGQADSEARAALELPEDVTLLSVEDDDAAHAATGPAPVVKQIELGGICVGRLALAPIDQMTPQDATSLSIIAREIAGPIRMALLVEESQRLATVDALTGLATRRAFVNLLAKEIARATRYDHALGFILLDVDHFKSVNDHHGHGTGDAVLSQLGATLQQELRACDIVARWGGEEFVIAMPATCDDKAMDCAERLRQATEKIALHDPKGEQVKVTCSLGVTLLRAGDTLDTLIDRADRAMYQAKAGGRNRVVAATVDGPASRVPRRTNFRSLTPPQA